MQFSMFKYINFNPRSHKWSDDEAKEYQKNKQNFNPRSHKWSDNLKTVTK